MKKAIYILITCLPLFATCQSSADKTTFIIDFDYWEGCETGKGECRPLTFYRTAIEDSVILVMPCGGTGTRVLLYGPGSGKPLDGKPLREISVDYAECPPTFDLTNLPDGDYIAYMLACGLGGPVNFSLVTRKK